MKATLQDAQVLVVGAGPVGLLAALRLREKGLQVRVIDLEPRIAGHTDACALHPHSLKLLDEFGLAAEAIRTLRLDLSAISSSVSGFSAMHQLMARSGLFPAGRLNWSSTSTKINGSLSEIGVECDASK